MHLHLKYFARREKVYLATNYHEVIKDITDLKFVVKPLSKDLDKLCTKYFSPINKRVQLEFMKPQF